MKNLQFTRSAYQRNLTQFFSLLFVFSLFILSGCQDEALTEIVPDGAVEVRSLPPNLCDCDYQIVGFTGTPLPLTNGMAYHFTNSTGCPDIPGCGVMDHWYNDNKNCAPQGLFCEPGFVDNILPVGEWFDFQCLIPGNASYPIRFNAYSNSENCEISGAVGELFVIFRCSAVETERPSGDLCAGASYITLPVPFTDSDPNNSPTHITNTMLLGCDCSISIQ